MAQGPVRGPGATTRPADKVRTLQRGQVMMHQLTLDTLDQVCGRQRRLAPGRQCCTRVRRIAATGAWRTCNCTGDDDDDDDVCCVFSAFRSPCSCALEHLCFRDGARSQETRPREPKKESSSGIGRSSEPSRLRCALCLALALQMAYFSATGQCSSGY